MRILVVYLIGPDADHAVAAQVFMDSYHNHKAGADHDLLLIRKGDTSLHPVGYLSNSLQICWHPNIGMDIWSLVKVCEDYSDYDYVLWFGSWSRILKDEWLYHYCCAADICSAVLSATGSWEAGVSGKSPNPHLRTNGLFIPIKLMNSLGPWPIYTRQDCYEFEHGNDSLYHRICTRSSFIPMVLDDYGHVFGYRDWPDSYTYRRGEQQHLLIADKQTDAYQNADQEKRVELARMAGWDP